MNLYVLKSLLLSGLFVLAVFCTFAPLALQWIPPAWQTNVLGVANAFSGGVFLAGGIVHMLTDSIEQFEDFEWAVELPLTQLLLSAGFLGVFFIEKVVFVNLPFVKEKDDDVCEEPPAPQPSTPVKEKSPPQSPNAGHGHSHAHVLSDHNPPENAKEHEGHKHHHAHYIKGESSLRHWVATVLTVVLSVHSFIAGMALGIQESESSVWTVFLAIVTHKWVEAFALGISLINDDVQQPKYAVYAVLYSCMTPIGVGFGMMLMALISGEAAAIISAITTAIAAGTFIYVAVVDIMVEEFMDPRNKYLKFLTLLIGFALMSSMFVLFDHEHAHSHSHS